MLFKPLKEVRFPLFFINKVPFNPELVNSDPYNDGWMIKIKISDRGDLLMSAEDYKKEIGN